MLAFLTTRHTKRTGRHRTPGRARYGATGRIGRHVDLVTLATRAVQF